MHVIPIITGSIIHSRGKHILFVSLRVWRTLDCSGNRWLGVSRANAHRGTREPPLSLWDLPRAGIFFLVLLLVVFATHSD